VANGSVGFKAKQTASSLQRFHHQRVHCIILFRQMLQIRLRKCRLIMINLPPEADISWCPEFSDVKVLNANAGNARAQALF